MNKGTEIFSLANKTVLLTGATGYLGQAMALVFAEAGAKVLVNSRSIERCEQLVERLMSLGLNAESAAFDVTSAAAVEAFAERMQAKPLHVLVNNAYVGGAGSIESANNESYTRSFEVTLGAAHRLVKSLLPSLRAAVKESGDASVINLGSMYGVVSPDQRIYENPLAVNPPFYGAAKAALLQWTRYAACEFGKEGIRFNSVTPGPFPSKDVQTANPSFIEKLALKVPLGRIGQADEMKGPLLFLASQAASFVNGANLAVDGGWTSW
jgi:NAD(P)-dependent dehydrogenase (short-subunit alcohol dehydrogenase family)